MPKFGKNTVSKQKEETFCQVIESIEPTHMYTFDGKSDVGSI